MKKMKREGVGAKTFKIYEILKTPKTRYRNIYIFVNMLINTCTSNLMIAWSLGTDLSIKSVFFQPERPSMVLGYMLLGITASVSAMICLHRKFRNCPKIYTHQRIVSLKTLSSSFPAKNLWQCETYQCSFFSFLNTSHVYHYRQKSVIWTQKSLYLLFLYWYFLFIKLDIDQ